MRDETPVRYFIKSQGGMLPTFAWDGEGGVEEFVSQELRKAGLFSDKAGHFRSHGECSDLGKSVHLVSVYAVREDVLTDPRRPGEYATLQELLEGGLNSLHRRILKIVVDDCKPVGVV